MLLLLSHTGKRNLCKSFAIIHALRKDIKKNFWNQLICCSKFEATSEKNLLLVYFSFVFSNSFDIVHIVQHFISVVFPLFFPFVPESIDKKLTSHWKCFALSLSGVYQGPESKFKRCKKGGGWKIVQRNYSRDRQRPGP